MKALRSMALGFGLLLITAAANAQGVNLRANIPFDFVAGNQNLPAGEYVVQPWVTGGAILTIRNSDGNKAASSVTYACGGGNAPEKTELIFHRVGRMYFLSQVQVEGHSDGSQLPKSRTEAEAQVASNQKAENVVIFAEVISR